MAAPAWQCRCSSPPLSRSGSGGGGAMDLGSPPLCPTRLHRPACLQGVSVGGAGARGRSSKAEKRKAFGPNSEGFCPSSRWEAMWGRAGVLGGVKRREAMIDRFTIHERERRGGESRVGGERGRERERESGGERDKRRLYPPVLSLPLSLFLYLSLSFSFLLLFPPSLLPWVCVLPCPSLAVSLSLCLSVSLPLPLSPRLSPVLASAFHAAPSAVHLPRPSAGDSLCCSGRRAGCCVIAVSNAQAPCPCALEWHEGESPRRVSGGECGWRERVLGLCGARDRQGARRTSGDPQRQCG